LKEYGREFEYKAKQQWKMPDPTSQHNEYEKLDLKEYKGI
jgi:hypothetical protein